MDGDSASLMLLQVALGFNDQRGNTVEQCDFVDQGLTGTPCFSHMLPTNGKSASFQEWLLFPHLFIQCVGGGGLGVGSLILPSRSWGSNTVIRLSIKHLHPLSHCTHRGFLVLGSKPEMLSFLRLPNEVSSSAHPSQKSSLLHFFNSYMCSCTPQVSFHHLSIW